LLKLLRRSARRIAQLHDYYFDHAPELTGYLLNPAELRTQ
jgi:hypothetical protein